MPSGVYGILFIGIFPSEQYMLYCTSTRLEYETRKVLYYRKYRSEIAQPKDGHVYRTPPSPQLPSTPLTSSGGGMVTRAVAIRLCVPRPRTGIDEEASHSCPVLCKPQMNEEPNLR